ncbi:MAG: ATP-binding protein [Richelia sp. SL_2_1]|nr:ATP-binding protein [Richelia sp. SL_2_1]
MSRNRIELTAIVISAVVGLTGFCFSHSRQPYPLAQIQFCPRSANKKEDILSDKNKAKKLKYYDLEKAQQKLDNKYCHQPRYVLAEEWDKYNSYGSIIPYMGSTISLVKTIQRDNPYQIYGNVATALGLWGISFTLLIRVNRLKTTDYQLGEEEKSTAYFNWQQHRRKRDIKQHSCSLHTDILKDGLTQEDRRQRKELGLTDDENEAIKNQLQLEDYLKGRAVKHSDMDKQIASNLLDKHKAEKEIDKLLYKKSSQPNISQQSDKQLVNSLIEALKSHEDGWLFDLINSVKPIFLIGDMGSAKTSMAVSLGLIREKLGHKVHRIADKHLNGENSDKWNLLKPECKHDNNSSILEALQDQIERRSERINQRPVEKEQFILDEFTQLAKISKEAKELIPLFVTSTYSDTRKAKELFIGVTHSFTNASFGDGNYELRGRGWLIEKFSVDGEKPIPRVVIKFGMKDKDGNNLEDVEKTLPSWFRPELIHGHFNDSPINFEN